MWIFRVNVLKIIVFVGTFSLAMAFAGNDLVNFIGVPLAGLASLKMFFDSGAADPGGYLMEGLVGKVPTPLHYLIIAGIIMVITLWVSKKAKSVTKTSIDLSRQEEGEERFGSSLFARVLVREGMRFGKTIGSIVPKPIANAMVSRYDQSRVKKKKEKTSFDLVRASVNLIVAAVLIAIGTSHKLPLSTTYVTFMVAMGTSLADGAWGRESAVYRITGVFTVIGGWFFTAFAAFTTSFIVANVINWGGIYAIIGFIILAILLVIRTHAIHKKSVEESEALAKEETEKVTHKTILDKCSNEVKSFYKYSSKSILEIVNALIKEKRKSLVNIKEDLKKHEKHLSRIKKKAHQNLLMLPEEDMEYGYFLINLVDQIEIAQVNLNEIFKLVFKHIDNNLKPLTDDLNKELMNLTELVVVFENNMLNVTEKPDKVTDKLIEQREILKDMVTGLQKKNIKQIKKSNVSSKTSLMFQGIMTEMKQYINNTYALLDFHRKQLKETKK